MNRKLMLFLSLVIVWAGTGSWSQDTAVMPGEQTGKVVRPLKTSQDAQLMTRSIAGLRLAQRITKSEKMVLSKPSLPFVGKKLVGREAWRMRIEDADLTFQHGDRKVTPPHIHTFEAIVLAETGQLLEIRSVVPLDVKIEPPLMSAADAEKRYEMTSELYEGLPDVPPEISFEEVLQRAYDSGIADIANAKQIIGYYLVSSQKGLRPPQRLWILQLRGMPPYPAKGISTASESERSHLRLLFDMQGEFILGDNQP